MRTAQDIVAEYIVKGYSKERLRALANGRPEPIRSEILKELEKDMVAEGMEVTQEIGINLSEDTFLAGVGSPPDTPPMPDIQEEPQEAQPEEQQPEPPEAPKEAPQAPNEPQEAPESAPEPEPEAEKEQISVVKTFRRHLQFEMSDAEIRELALRGARIGQDIVAKRVKLGCDEDAWKAQKKVIEAEVEALAVERVNLENDIVAGKVFRSVECCEKKDWNERKVFTIRNDTGKCISERDMTESELQVEIPFEEKEKSKVTAEEAEDNSQAAYESAIVNGVPDKTEEPVQEYLTLEDAKDVVYVDDLGRRLYISDGGTGKKYSTYYKKAGGQGIYEKKPMPPVSTVAEAAKNLEQYAKEHNLVKPKPDQE